MSESILCPIKETMVFPSVCEKKCSYGRAKCESMKAERKERTKHCIDCGNDESRLCEECLEDARTRPLWTLEKPKQKEPEQMSLF